MTKKTYILFATGLGKYFRKKDYFDGAINTTAKMDITDIICRYLKEDNPRFDSKKFRAAINSEETRERKCVSYFKRRDQNG